MLQRSGRAAEGTSQDFLQAMVCFFVAMLHVTQNSKICQHHMRKKPKIKNLSPPQKCIFCNEAGRSHTHIWPDWLNRLLAPGEGREETTISTRDPPNLPPEYPKKIVRKQGSIFSLKPRLACETCNNGWMNRFEDELLKFAKPLFLCTEKTKLNTHQMRIFIGWMSLVTMLAEFIQR
jgi:hypothetical protein